MPSLLPVLEAYDMASRGFAEIKPDEEDWPSVPSAHVIIPPLLLRMKVAKSVRDYEAMRDADSPPPEARDRVAENIRQHNSSVGVHLILSTWWLSLDEALVNGVRSLRSLQQMKEEARSPILSTVQPPAQT
ncbi:hypothetical protein AK812_SmicGene34442 [Symbiodinium microadriaticum]|uniref:Uncharacterized protein n=1 Tax=Symbiodinium microadriaticum TaxID=2951 RepID=A0A1Q9CP42_SYMMI|nr:hypothetical protein AK812_SmicGene34442 [Symbiodinium microadriaticum]